MASGKRRNYRLEKIDAQISFWKQLPALVQQMNDSLLALGTYLTAQKTEVARVGKEAEQEADSPELRKKTEETHFKRLEAEQLEYEARITKARAEMMRWQANLKEWEGAKGSQPKGYTPHGRRSEIQNRVEEKVKPPTVTEIISSANEKK